MSEYYIIDFGVNFANNTRYPGGKNKIYYGTIME